MRLRNSNVWNRKKMKDINLSMKKGKDSANKKWRPLKPKGKDWRKRLKDKDKKKRPEWLKKQRQLRQKDIGKNRKQLRLKE